MIWSSSLPVPLRRSRPSSKFWNAYGLKSRRRPSPQKKPLLTGGAFYCSETFRLRRAVGLMFQLLLLEVGYQGINQRLESAIHHFLQLMDGQTNAVIADTVLRKVISADLLAAVA